MSEFPELDYALDKLTREWVPPVDVVDVEHPRSTSVLPPLIDMVQDLVTAVTRGQGGPGSGQRNVLNVRAFQVLSDIRTMTIRWLKREHEKPPEKLTEALRLAVKTRLDLWHTKDLTEAEIVGMQGQLELWAKNAWELFDAPKEFFIADGTTPKPCPVCGESWAEDEDGDRIPAVVVRYVEGDLTGTVEAVCRSCNAIWKGTAQLHSLNAQMTKI